MNSVAEFHADGVVVRWESDHTETPVGSLDRIAIADGTDEESTVTAYLGESWQCEEKYHEFRDVYGSEVGDEYRDGRPSAPVR